MNNMGVDWLLSVLAMAQDTITIYVVTPFLFASMGAMAIISLVIRNLRVRFFPLMGGASPLQMGDERPELVASDGSGDGIGFRSHKEVLERFDAGDQMKIDHMDIPF